MCGTPLRTSSDRIVAGGYIGVVERGDPYYVWHAATNLVGSDRGERVGIVPRHRAAAARARLEDDLTRRREARNGDKGGVDCCCCSARDDEDANAGASERASETTWHA